MTEETIVTDVSDDLPIEGDGSEVELEQKAPEGPLATREAKMAAIHEKRVEERETDRKAAALINNPDMTEEEFDDAQLSGNEDDDPAGEGEQLAQLTDGDDAQPSASAEPGPGDLPPAALNGWRENDAGVNVRQLSVNGRVVEVTQEQYERFAQKDMAGDEKINRAAAVDKVLTQRERVIVERERSLADQEQLPVKGDGVDRSEMIKEYQEALFEGDSDAASEKLNQLLESGRSNEPTLRMDDVVAQATTRMERNAAQKATAEDVRLGFTSFQEQYSDVFADDDALAFADIQIKKLEKSNPELPFSARALKAGEITRARLGLSGGDKKPTDHGGQLRNERQERKLKLTPIPGTRRPHKPKEAPKVDLSTGANIARMRAGRAR